MLVSFICNGYFLTDMFETKKADSDGVGAYSRSQSSSDMEPQRHRHNELVAGHNLHDHDGLPDGIGVVLPVTESHGYLLNHGRRWHGFLINVQVHNAKTASGTTVAIADKAKVYILMPVATLGHTADTDVPL